MEDHRDAYFHWKELGLQNQVCLHIDAHLDVSNFKAPGYETDLSPRINCGNFLFPALSEDLLSALIWVLPPHLPGEEDLLDWTRLELQNWLRLELADYMSLHQVGSRVEGKLLGKPFTVCFSDQIPEIDTPYVLDIDIDYYLDPSDGLWQSPIDLAGQLEGVGPPTATTIAYSVQGGYTPPCHRYLGPLTQRALEDRKAASEIWSALQDRQLQSLPEAWPDWTRAALFAKSRRLKEAAAIDPGYHIQAIDRVSAALMRGQYSQAKAHLRHVEKTSEAKFLQGLIALRTGKFDEALKIWTDLAEHGLLEHDTRIYLLTNCGRAYLDTKRYSQAYQTLKKACLLSENDSELTVLLARASVFLKSYDEAAKLFQRAIELAPGLLETSETRLELAELYIEQGQLGPAKRLVRETMNGNTPGFTKLRAEALQLKLMKCARPAPSGSRFLSLRKQPPS